MEATDVGTFVVEMILNGETKRARFKLKPTVTIESVEAKLRSTFNVTNGSLSLNAHDLEIVDELVAGGVYYFIEFTPPPQTGATAGGASTVQYNPPYFPSYPPPPPPPPPFWSYYYPNGPYYAPPPPPNTNLRSVPHHQSYLQQSSHYEAPAPVPKHMAETPKNVHKSPTPVRSSPTWSQNYPSS